ncbi:hypothetical protein H6F77_21240 [Microcoleus sp. FACHB-831]|uniref:hypothetical protein n=1 Tax=Microcoleus sp. FACHB-831 TaxID=2692827 RepID=UPI0016866983|nr:hypothetical protein [Microcoleus sp. FACHB-831]MBD1923577.1 hypothetical protein [Microcoleus sp. FACHB-831]
MVEVVAAVMAVAMAAAVVVVVAVAGVVEGVAVKFDAIAVNFSLLLSWLKPWFPRKPELTCSNSVLSMKYANYRSD